MSKQCSRCGELKPFAEYHRRLDGYAPRCKPCQSEYAKGRYRTNQDAEVARAREWRQANPNKHRESAKRYRANALRESPPERSGEWTPEEDDLLLAATSSAEAARALGRSFDSVRMRRDWLNNTERVRARWAAHIQELQAATLPTATNWGKEWTGPELEIVADYTRTAKEIALLLGRSVKAVQSQRRLLRMQPRSARLAGLDTDVADKAAP